MVPLMLEYPDCNSGAHCGNGFNPSPVCEHTAGHFIFASESPIAPWDP